MSTDKHLANDQEGTLATDLSIIVPAYNEAGNVTLLYGAIETALRKIDLSWELIFCDDGSEDNTWQEITGLSLEDRKVSGVRLSRNFGHQYALLAGLKFAVGRAVITMDADNQHPPDVIPKLIDSWNRGNKIVQTVRIDPESTGVFKRITSYLYYRIYSFLSGVNIQPGMADFRLLDRKVVNDLLEFREEGLFLRGLVQWVGYTSETISFVAEKRSIGVTKYTLRKMLRLAWTGITSFSIIPLRIGIFVGLFTSIVAFGGMFASLYLPSDLAK